MDLDAYVSEHAGQWRRLEQLTGKRRLGAPEVDELISLYQRTGTHLSVIRSRSPDPALVARLSRIVLSARGAITGGSAFSWRTVGRFFTATFPLAVLQAWRWWCAVATVFSGLAFLMMYYVAARPAGADRRLRGRRGGPADRLGVDRAGTGAYAGPGAGPDRPLRHARRARAGGRARGQRADRGLRHALTAAHVRAHRDRAGGV